MVVKNIIVCADETGSKGGYSPDSNVYKIYNAVDKNFNGKAEDGVNVSEQMVFYDNGVGTNTNKYLRLLGGAFGFGFGKNVRDLYKFIARNYEKGDRIYFFGFSRGASTVRACNGMINKCGLVKGKALRNYELDVLVAEVFKAYKNHKDHPAMTGKLRGSELSHGAVKIKFLGVWDTVVALGFPKRTDVTGPITFILNILFGLLEGFFNFILPHNFYHYKLTDNVEYACQALSIDDERTAFWPHVWKEKNIKGACNRTVENVEQVWFAGMHSNVGGGYERAGMAGVPLRWILNRAEKHGLTFGVEKLQEIYSTAHIHGRMYNSRDGVAFLYRYHPREIEKLCKDRLLTDVKIHCSVMERMNHRTANYAPRYIPGKIAVVDSTVPAKTLLLDPAANQNWEIIREKINKVVLRRKQLYGVMLTGVITVIVATLYFKEYLINSDEASSASRKAVEVLSSVLPDIFTGLINVTVANYPIYSLVAVVFIILYLVTRAKLNKRTVKFAEALRHCIIQDFGHQLSCGKKSSTTDVG